MYKDHLTVKKEKCSSSLPPRRSVIDLVVKTLGSWKRKTVESVGISLENLNIEDVLQKLVSFSQAMSVSFIIILCFTLLVVDPLCLSFRYLIMFLLI